MKRTLFAIAILLVPVASPAAAQNVFVDYDTYKTFAWVDTNTTSLKIDFPEVDSMIKNNIECYMVKGGMSEDLENPDVYVTDRNFLFSPSNVPHLPPRGLGPGTIDSRPTTST